MEEKNRKRPCKICGEDLNQWGDRKGICPTCADAVRSTVVECAGRCKKKYPLRMMEGVLMYFDPGQKGGKKYKLYYCSSCALAARSRARGICESQNEEIKKTHSRRERQALEEQKARKENEKCGKKFQY